MAKRAMFQIVGRYMSGSSVTGYHLQSLETGKSGKYSKEQVCLLIGRGQITNCDGQIYKDTVLLRGVNCQIEALPVIQEDGSLSRADGLGRVKRGTSAQDAVTNVNIVGVIRSGRNNVGYVVANAGGGTYKFARDKVMLLAKEGRIGNARVQMHNGKAILRGIGVDLGSLPVTVIDE